MASTQTIIINSDGSIKQRVLGEYINQGNDLVDTIYIGFVDDTIASSYVGTANFELPNGDTNTLVGTYVSGIALPNDTTNYKGYKIVLTQAQTIYNGQLKMSFVVTNGEEILYSYKTTFTINASVVAADEEKITLAQWNSLVNNLATYQVAYNEYNVRGYSSQEKATSDYENLDTDQISLFSDGSNLYYFKGGEDDLNATKIANYDDISKVSNALPITGGTMQGDIDMNAKSLTNVNKVAFAPSIDLETIAELKTEIDGENAYLKLYSKYINVSSLACQMNWLVDGGIEFYKSISANKGITNLPAPTNDSDAVNKEYVDDNFATKVQLTSGQVVPMKSGAATYDSSGFNISQTYATKTYVNEKLSSVYVYKGSVASYSKLPISGLTTGDVYNVEDTGMNYAWTGSKWDALGSTIDTSAFVLKSGDTMSGMLTVNSSVAMQTGTVQTVGSDNKSIVNRGFALAKAGDTMTGNLKVDEIDNTYGNALVRYKSTESKNVFGGSNYDCVLMGNSTRPYYSNNGSDFSGNELALKSDIDTKQDTLVSGTNIKTINNQSLLGSGNISISGGGSGSDTYFIDVYFGNQKRTQPSAHITSRGLSSAEVDYFKTTITNYVNTMIGGGSLSYENAVKYIGSVWNAGALDVAKKNTILCKLVFLLQGIFGEMTFYRCLSSDSGNTLQIVSQTSYTVFILDISASDSPEYISMVTYLSNASLNLSGITIDTDSNFINYIE